MNLLMPKETNVSSACKGTEGTLVFFRCRFRRWGSGRGGNAWRGRERMVPLLFLSMIHPLIVAASISFLILWSLRGFTDDDDDDDDEKGIDDDEVAGANVTEAGSVE